MELNMPTRIPVRIADKPFPSMNQARVHYLKILYRYQKGQSEPPRESWRPVGLSQATTMEV